MIVERPTLHPMARSALEDIQAQGVEVTPDIVLWLHEAAKRIRSTPERPLSDLVDWPVDVGNVKLYPLSFGAAAWLARLPERVRYDVRSVAFACANSFDHEKLASLSSPLRAKLAIIWWALKLKCSTRALEVAVDSIMGVDTVDIDGKTPTVEKKSTRHEYGAVIVALCNRYTGTTPDYWMWQVSREKSLSMIREINAELPEDKKITDYEIDMTEEFESIVAHIIKEGKKHNG